jgi:hypothetical protein
MKLSYVDILGDGERHNIKATVTTDHPNSSYGQPVLLLGDGQPLNAESWFLMAYQVVKATPDEFELLKKWVSLLSFLLEVDETAAARSLGKIKSEKKTLANRAKANLPPKEGKKPRGWQKGIARKPKDNDAR